MRALGASLVAVFILLSAAGTAPGLQDDRPAKEEKPAAEGKPKPDISPFYAGRLAVREGRASSRLKTAEDTARLGLDWLSRHQSPLGFWDCDGFSAQCRLNQCDGKGRAVNDTGVTGLALLAYLATGETPFHGDRRKELRSATLWLMTNQDDEGCIGPRGDERFVYGHAIATQALSEAYGMTRSPFLEASAQRALDFIAKCQNPYLAWRYGVRPGDNDTSVSACMVLALFAGKKAGLSVEQTCFDGMKNWLEKVTETEYGRVGYTARGTGPARGEGTIDRFPPDKSESLTAAAIFCRMLMGEDPRKSEMIQKGVDLCVKVLPLWDTEQGSIDMYYWYWGTLSLFQVGGDSWPRWEEAIRCALVDSQRKDGDEKGSWDPVGAWGKDGGRVYSTALATLSLEVYSRYPRIYAGKAKRGGLSNPRLR
jgi:hypothetical protein